jgi:hypothetical protein
MGGYIGWFITFLITTGIFMKLLDMDFFETLMCSCFIFVIQTWVATALMITVLGGLGIRGLPVGTFGMGGGGGGGGRIMLSGEVDRDEDDSLDAIRARDSDEYTIGMLHSGGVEAKPWIEEAPNRVLAGQTREKSLQIVRDFYAAGVTELRVYPHKNKKKNQEITEKLILVAPQDGGDGAKAARKRIMEKMKALAKHLGRTTPRDRGEKYWPIEMLTGDEARKEMDFAPDDDAPAAPAKPGAKTDDDDEN